MKLAILLVALVAVSGVTGSRIKTRLSAKYAPYSAQYDQAYDQFREEPVAEAPVAEAAPEAPQEGGMKPAIIEGGQEEAPAEPTLLPPEPVLTKPGGEEEQEEDPATEEQDPEIIKLNTALEAVKEDIISTSKQIADERKWVAAVMKITQSYEEKVKRVQEHILLLRQEMTKLYKKKKQIENLKLQRALEAKLREANEELTTLQNSLKHVQEKHEELDKSHMDLRSTIADINKQLATLKGEDPAKAAVEEKEEIKEAVEADQLEEASTREAAELMADEEKKDTFLA